MNLEYLHLNVSVDEVCTTMSIKLGFFLYEPSLGLAGGTLHNEAAFQFLKYTIYGKQSDIINFNIMFGPDTTYNPQLKLIVEIPPINDVKFKDRKFLRYKRFKNFRGQGMCKKTKLFSDSDSSEEELPSVESSKEPSPFKSSREPSPLKELEEPAEEELSSTEQEGGYSEELSNSEDEQVEEEDEQQVKQSLSVDLTGLHESDV